MPDYQRKPTDKEAQRLEREMERERKRRDKAVNNSRNRKPSTHIPSPRKSKREIMGEIT